MPNRLKWKSVTRRMFQSGTVLILAAISFAGRAQSQEAPKNEKIFVVTHVDSVPTEQTTAVKLLKQYVIDTRKDKGAERIEAYIQTSRPNHFTIVEVWQNQQDFDAHEAAAHTRKFREEIQPMLGSPFDERLHQLLE